jgi:hypothetical protein
MSVTDQLIFEAMLLVTVLIMVTHSFLTGASAAVDNFPFGPCAGFTPHHAGTTAAAPVTPAISQWLESPTLARQDQSLRNRPAKPANNSGAIVHPARM